MKRLEVGLVVLLLLASGVSACRGTAPSESPSGPLPVTCVGDTCHFEDEILGFDYPAGWRAATFFVVSSFTNDLVYLSTAPLSDPCDRTASSVACIRLAATSLGKNGLLVTWTAMGFPAWTFDPGKGSPLSVGQRQATQEEQAPSESCQAIGGVHEVIVTIPRSAPGNLMQLDACLAGPDPAAAQGQVEAMLQSVRWKD